MPWETSELKFDERPKVKAAPTEDRKGQFFIGCMAKRPEDTDEDGARDFYMHKDGLWHEHATPNGYFKSRKEADDVLAGAK